MQFNSNDSGSSLHSEINITPLVDVVLVLLIIFMVVVPLLMEGYDVDVPRASADTSAQVAESQLILSIGSAACPILGPPAEEGIPKDCQVTLADQKIPAAELPARVAAILGGRPAEQRALFLAVGDRLNYEAGLRIIDLQILNARFRELNDALNRLVVQAIVDSQEQSALFRRPAAQNRRNARGQFGYRDLLIRQGHLTVLRDPLPCRRREDRARRGTDAQDQLGFGNRGRRIGGGSRDIHVVALHQEWHDDHKYDQQYEHHVDERRDIDFRLQTGTGIVVVELHDVTFLLRQHAWRSAPPRENLFARSRP